MGLLTVDRGSGTQVGHGARTCQYIATVPGYLGSCAAGLPGCLGGRVLWRMQAKLRFHTETWQELMDLEGTLPALPLYLEAFLKIETARCPVVRVLADDGRSTPSSVLTLSARLSVSIMNQKDKKKKKDLPIKLVRRRR